MVILDIEVLKRWHSVTIFHPVVLVSHVAWALCAHGELSEGMHNIGWPKICFKNQCKTSTMEFSINVATWDMIEWGGELLLSQEQRAIKRTVQHTVEAKSANATLWMTPQYSTIMVVKNCADHTLVVLAITYFFLLTIAINKKGHIYKMDIKLWSREISINAHMSLDNSSLHFDWAFPFLFTC